MYNINNNSRYSYQYICSYNSSKEFIFAETTRKTQKRLTKEILDDYVQCVQVEKIIDNNLINLFSEKYKDKYYCSRTNMPKDYPLVKQIYCNNKIRKILIKYVFYPINYCQIIYVELLIFYLIMRKSEYNINNNINLNIHVYNLSNNSTKEDEIPNRNNIDYIQQLTRNIIIENKKEIPIKENINDFK